MKHLLFIILLSVSACSTPTDQSVQSADTFTTTSVTPSNGDIAPSPSSDTTAQSTPPTTLDSFSTPPASFNKSYGNKRFKDVIVEKIGASKYRITGKGQIFEASFGWVVEDGHRELKSGHEMTDMGAPEWGNFSFTVDVAKQRPNSTLHLILFETSAKDGSRQHELPIPLY